MSAGTFTRVISNGSGYVAPLAVLFERLAVHTLDPSFELHGNFVGPCHGAAPAGYDHSAQPPRLQWLDTGPLYPEHPQALQFWGNFLDVSHVFCVHTDDPETVKALSAAIRANQATPAYVRAQIAVRQPAKAAA